MWVLTTRCRFDILDREVVLRVGGLMERRMPLIGFLGAAGTTTDRLIGS